MSASSKVFVIAFLALSMFGSETLAQSTVTIKITSPTADQSYAPNTPIDYTGNGTFDPKKDIPLGSVRVQLVWTSSTTPPNPGQGYIVSSDSAAVTIPTDAAGNQTGTYTYENSTNSTTGKSSLVATQYVLGGTKRSITYTIIAYPMDNHRENYYSDAQGLNQIFTTKQLGLIN